MGEEISRLMDGELEDGDLDVAYAGLKHAGTAGIAPGFSQRLAARLTAEPTVIAPRAAPARPLAYAWAAAAGVAAAALVGWVAFGTLQTETAAIANAGGAAPVRGAPNAPRTLPADYLIAHQEYSPSAQLQGNAPYLRSVAVPAGDARP
jgi:hypothetical protein